METFISKLAKHIKEENPESLENICIILPNRRAKLYLLKEFSKLIDKTIWSPEIFAIEDFIYLISGMQKADNLKMIFDLYEVHKTIAGKDADKFETFLNWSNNLLQDFNEIDMYLVNANDIFSYIEKERKISVWNPSGKEITETQKRYVEFYASLKLYYDDFTSKLLTKKQVYAGLAYRKAAENIESIEKELDKKIYFAGFNALNKAEEKIIKHLVSKGKAEIIWDADKYLIENTEQESGFFLREYKKVFKDFKYIEDNLSQHKKINITGTASNIMQVKYVGEILDNFPAEEKKNLSNTAVVLADENLLLPLLSSIGNDIEKLNITMGFPLKSHTLFNFINLIFELHINSKKFNKRIGSDIGYYFMDVIKIFQHPYINYILINNFKKSEVFLSYKKIEEIHKNNLSKIKFDLIDIKDFKFIFEEKEGKEICKTFYDLFDFLIKKRINKIDKEFIYSYKKIIEKIENYIKDIEIDIKTIYLIFSRICSSQSLPFYGEPLEGLQIMGLLETRNLDFENIIMLSVNESILPFARNNNSYIPVDVRTSFNLPVYSHKDSIFAYHFYRLISRAKNVEIIYNTENSTFGKEEKSRFITQILNEFPEKFPQIEINEKIININVSKDDILKPISIIKDINKLKNLKSLSASALNYYKNCSLKFYYAYIMRLEEENIISETIESNLLGTVIHEVLKNIYNPFIGKQINANDLNKHLPKIEKSTIEVFKKHYTSSSLESGKNLLIVKMAVKYITLFLEAEIDYISNNKTLTILGLEEKYKYKLKDEFNGIIIKGIIDRIDKVGDEVRIIDYKTSLYNDKFDLKDKVILNDSTNDKLLQLLLYSWLYKRNNNETDKITPGIVNLSKNQKDLQKITFYEKDHFEYNHKADVQTQEIIENFVKDIFNKDKAFEQTTNKDNCKFCSFKGICIR